jgi:glycosyltransferase involved in cell wall biosynthesis
MVRMIRISAVITARNEEKNIAYCLETLQWCDEIIVIDMESEDKTVEIARKFTERIYSHPKVLAFDIAKKYAVELASGDWILLLDADEMVSVSLAAELKSLSLREDLDIVKIPFRHYILGDIVNYSGWNDTPLPRFFRQGAILFSDKIHDYMHPKSSAKMLRLESVVCNSIRHFSYTDSSHFVDKLNRYTNTEAQHLYDRHVKFSCFALLNATLRQFWWRYISLSGYKDGVRGFLVCLMMTFYQAMCYIKLWEMYEFEHDPVTERYERIRQEVLKQWKDTDQ